MTDRKYTEEEIAWAKTFIQPELPEYDEKDHEIAKLRFILDAIHEQVSEIWVEGKFLIEGKQLRRGTFDDLPGMVKALHDVLYGYDDTNGLPDGTDQDEIDKFAALNGWEKTKKEHLEGWHCGDCTAVAATCMKCYAEQFYHFKTPYEGKANGWKALAIFSEANKQTNK